MKISFAKTTVKKYYRDRFLRKSMDPGGGGCTQISLTSHNSGFTCRSQKRFSLFYSSSKALSADISLTLKLNLHLTHYGDVSRCGVTI